MPIVEVTVGGPRHNDGLIRGMFRGIANAFFKVHSEAKYELAHELHSALVQATPKDTGRAAAGWAAGVEGRTVLPTLDYTVKAPNSFVNAGFNAPRKIGRFEEYEIVNDVPYMVFLNEGHSQQAPPNFIEMTVDEVIMELNSKHSASVDIDSPY